ncbi:MAG: TonB-dependent receptor [Flavobacteriales bacterium]|nr:TonB-dependent receptor [Flavobacteriales bacterium]
MSDRAGEENTLAGALVSATLGLNKNNDVGIVLLHNQGGTSTARYQLGRIPSIDAEDIKEQRTLRYVERAMSVAQLKGDHTFSSGAKVDWISSLTISSQDTPDMRTFDNDYSFRSDGSLVYDIDEAAYLAPNRYFREMSEVNFDNKVNVTIPLDWGVDSTSSTLKFGASHLSKQRQFSEKRFEYAQYNTQFSGNIEEFFSDANMDATSDSFVYVQDLTDSRNTYEASETISAGYVMVDWQALSRLRIVGGARAEKAFTQATSLKYFEQADDFGRAKYRGTLDNLDVLPSLNFTFAQAENTNIRGGYTRTLARPTFRELAPFASFDFETRYVKIGNPNLQRTLVDNVDLRYEIYPNLGEIVSVSAFYKNFTDPIELVINPMAANVELSWQNQTSARVIGAEFEARKKLDFISERVESFTAGLNVTLVHSQTTINPEELAQIRSQDPDHADTRQMFGQSPYVVNASLGYKDVEESHGWSASLAYNVAGPKLALVVGGGTPNVFDQPRHDLSLTVTKQLSETAQLRIRGKNLLNAENEMIYTYKGTEYTFQSFELGSTISASLSLMF